MQALFPWLGHHGPAVVCVCFLCSRQSVSGVFRIFRVLRISKLVKYSHETQRLLQTLYLSLPSVLNVGTLVLLLFFIYAVIGMQLFGNVAEDVGARPQRMRATGTNTCTCFAGFRLCSQDCWFVHLRPPCVLHGSSSERVFACELFVLVCLCVAVRAWTSPIMPTFPTLGSLFLC